MTFQAFTFAILKAKHMPEIAEAEWPELIRLLRDLANVDASVAASERIHKEATAKDIPRLKEHLRDPGAFIREAAAWPLSELAGASVLPRTAHCVSKRSGRRI